MVCSSCDAVSAMLFSATTRLSRPRASFIWPAKPNLSWLPQLFSAGLLLRENFTFLIKLFRKTLPLTRSSPWRTNCYMRIEAESTFAY